MARQRRAKAIVTEAQAKANDLVSRGIRGTLVQYAMSKPWNGQMLQVVSSATALIALPRP